MIKKQKRFSIISKTKSVRRNKIRKRHYCWKRKQS